MAEYEILQGAQPMTLDQIDNLPRPSEAARPFTSEETDITVSQPSFDESKRDPNVARYAGKSLTDSFLNLFLDNPATHMRAVGKELEEDPESLAARLETPDTKSRRQAIIEKLTSTSVAIRDHLDMSKDEMTPPNFFYQLVGGVASLPASIGPSLVAGGGAGAVAKAAGSAPQVIKSAQLAGAAFSSYSMEKPVLEKELMDAGFEAGFADRMSTYYAIPVAMLDAGSLGFLTGVMKPAASKAVSTTVGRMVARGALGFVESPWGGMAAKALAEGGTEAIQGQIQTEFEVGLKLQSRDFQNDLSSRAVEFIVGALAGGAFHVKHTTAQLTARKDAIEYITEKHGLPRSVVAAAYDQSTLDGINRTLDELGQERTDAIGTTVQERADSIQKAIDRAQGRQSVNSPEQVESNNQKLLLQAQEALAKTEAEIKAQPEGKPTDKQAARRSSLEGRVQRLSDLTGLGGNKASEPVRLRLFKDIQNTFKAGQKYQIDDIQRVHDAFRRMLRGTKLSLKATKGVLKNVLSIKTSEEFNQKQGQVIEAIDTIVNGEKVENLRNVASDILDRMTTVGQVNPKTIVYSEHLENIFNGKVPAPTAPASNNSVDVAKYAMETLMADLAENDTDTDAAERAVTALKDFYTGELANRLQYTEQVAQDDERIAKSIISGLVKGQPISPRKAGLDSVRQGIEKTGLMKLLFPSPYIESFLSIANDIDAGQGKPNMQGTMVKELDPAKPYRAWMTLLHRTREAIDYKLAEIYGPKFLETLTLNQTANFINVEFVDQVTDAEGKVEEVPGEQINITKGAAMSLYMMQKNAKIRAQMIKMGYSETWLDAFAEGNVFNSQDHAWMNQVDAILKDYAKQIQPIFEKLTGKPFRAVDNYFMIQRYMYSEDMAGDDVASVVKAMMDGEFEVSDPSNDPRFKKRINSKKEFVVPDITEAITRYASDMNHFISYAEYAYKLKALLSNPQFAAAIKAAKSEGISTTLNKFLEHIVDGSQSRVSDRAAMKAHFTALGWLARSKIASPRSGFMQFTALASFTDPTASTPVNSLELAQAILDMPRAFRDGDVKNLLDTGYMQERWLGAFDQASKMAEDMARFGVFSQKGKFDPGGVLKKLGTNKVLQEWITLSTRLGDRGPSLAGGWAVYQKVLKQTGDPKAAVEAAIKMIEEVNGSLDPGKSAEVYQRSDFVSTLFKLFTRSTSIYLDRYVRMHKAFAAGQLTKAQYAKGLALYHVWIPMFTSAVAMGAGNMFDDDEIKTMMLSGPLAYHLFIGGMFKAAAAGLLAVTGINEKFSSGYDQSGDLLDGYSQDFTSVSRMIVRELQEFNFEDGWEAVAKAGKLGDITPLPVGYISRQPEALQKILEGYWTQGIMEMMGYSSAATKVE